MCSTTATRLRLLGFDVLNCCDGRQGRAATACPVCPYGRLLRRVRYAHTVCSYTGGISRAALVLDRLLRQSPLSMLILYASMVCLLRVRYASTVASYRVSRVLIHTSCYAPITALVLYDVQYWPSVLYCAAESTAKRRVSGALCTERVCYWN
eukprot:3789031-Rhodomonas_salina.1